MVLLFLLHMLMLFPLVDIVCYYYNSFCPSCIIMTPLVALPILLLLLFLCYCHAYFRCQFCVIIIHFVAHSMLSLHLLLPILCYCNTVCTIQECTKTCYQKSVIDACGCYDASLPIGVSLSAFLDVNSTGKNSKPCTDKATIDRTSMLTDPKTLRLSYDTIKNSTHKRNITHKHSIKHYTTMQNHTRLTQAIYQQHHRT